MEKIISGGQSGVDRAALDFAIQHNISHGGWCPRGRKAEDSIIDAKYNLLETDSSDYIQRTEWNVRDTDATLILNTGKLDGGTALTVTFTNTYSKPCLIVNPDESIDLPSVYNWIVENKIKILNVAGPRESKRPGIYKKSLQWLNDILLSVIKDENGQD